MTVQNGWLHPKPLSTKEYSVSLKTRTTQHKPQREEQKAKELSDLKRENSQLKKQVSRLRKQISRLVEVHGLDIKVDGAEEAEETPPMVVEVPELTMRCERCGGEAMEIDPGGKRFLVCTVKGCMWRKKLLED